ncbi:MAG TPA: DUF1697 domain-containing protein [Steroidobacteraceae bacterium]|jgi:uncharacterized protein (DUF1697 family)|nr:DUF1697 domain-containing protein [Steroidobacteraceae bacterium]
MTICIALIRGINVGRGNRVAMSNLRDLMIELGHTNVRTLLNSGNIIFQSKRASAARIASAIENAITANCGFSAAVTVMSAQELDLIVDENPLLHAVDDHARHLVAFITHPKHLEVLRPMLAQRWKPDALAITNRTAYLWCSTGILDSKLLKTFSRMAGATVTTRNWATVLKLQAAAKEGT